MLQMFATMCRLDSHSNQQMIESLIESGTELNEWFEILHLKLETWDNS